MESLKNTEHAPAGALLSDAEMRSRYGRQRYCLNPACNCEQLACEELMSPSMPMHREPTMAQLVAAKWIMRYGCDTGRGQY